MTRLLSRTSITKDEAVYILLGLSTGPIEFEPLDGAEGSEEDEPVFCLREALEDELDVVAGEYEMAKYEKQPDDVISEKRAALKRHEALIEQANRYHCAIQDELNKGEESALKLDKALSNPVYQFITLHSFNEWRRRAEGEHPDREGSTESGSASPEGTEKKAPRKKLRDQEDAILDEIRRQGLDPLALPPNPPGRRGVKASIREALDESPLFTGSTVFDKAWERLAKHRRIGRKT